MDGCTICGSTLHHRSQCPLERALGRNKLSPSQLVPAYPADATSPRVLALCPGPRAPGYFFGGVVIHADSIGDGTHRGNPPDRQWGGGAERARKPLERAIHNPSLFALVLREADPIGALFGALARRAG